MRKLAYIFCLVAFISSCSTQKGLKEVEDATKVVSESGRIIQQTISKKSNFTHLTIRGKANADLGDIAGGVSITMYVNNGQKIWVNASKLGYSGARALITPTGFQAFEKIGRTYYEGDFSLANKLMKVDFIDFQKFQNLLIGKVFVDFDLINYSAELKDDKYVVRYLKNETINANPISGEYVQTYVFDKGFRLEEARLKDPKRKMEITLNYQNWVKVGQEEFPKNVKIIIKDKKTKEVDLEYNSFTFEETNTPFSIPNGYTKKDIK